MKTEININVIEFFEEEDKFTLDRLRAFLSRSGADRQTISQIVDSVKKDIYAGNSTKEIYN